MDPEQIPLRALHLPDAIGWWPLAPGWWVVIGLAVLGVLLLLRRAVELRGRSAPRRHAMRQFERLKVEYERHGNAVTLSTDLSGLTRRTMLAYAQRADVAGLTGEDWLAWLDRGLAEPIFVAGAGRNLLELPYRDPAADVANVDIDGLLVAVRLRLETPLGGPG
ncbi:MAG: DUF4381 domain-containing protein [Proteobacteria bacterium]|nr:DUF4381 domain-containing protein [Pseudomonadota bacterium]